MGCKGSKVEAAVSLKRAHSRKSWLAVETKKACSSYSAPHGQLPPKRIGLHSNHGLKPAGASAVAKINQDRGLISYPLVSGEQALFGVYDGHGLGGEHVAQAVAFKLVDLLHDSGQALLLEPKECLARQVGAVAEWVKKNPKLHVQRSGTTAIVLLLQDKHAYVACVGDSRCVKGARSASGDKWVAHDLSVDQRADRPDEKARVEAAGAFVTTSSKNEPARLWASEAAFYRRNGHNLAMARSIGDVELEPYGLTAEPELVETELSASDECILLASDGVWEFLTSQEAMDVCYAHREDATAACKALINKASERWAKEEGNYRDDITAIVIFLPVLNELQSASADEEDSGAMLHARATQRSVDCHSRHNATSTTTSTSSRPSCPPGTTSDPSSRAEARESSRLFSRRRLTVDSPSA